MNLTQKTIPGVEDKDSLTGQGSGKEGERHTEIGSLTMVKGQSKPQN